MEAYFRQNISYNLDMAKWNGLQRFLKLVKDDCSWTLHRDLATTLSK
jgi:hypothetical protein